MDLDSVPLDERMPGVDYFAARPAIRHLPPADWRDRLAEIEARLAKLEADPGSSGQIAARLDNVELRMSRAAKVVGWLLSQVKWLLRKFPQSPQPQAGANGTAATGEKR